MISPEGVRLPAPLRSFGGGSDGDDDVGGRGGGGDGGRPQTQH